MLDKGWWLVPHIINSVASLLSSLQVPLYPFSLHKFFVIYAFICLSSVNVKFVNQYKKVSSLFFSWMPHIMNIPDTGACTTILLSIWKWKIIIEITIFQVMYFQNSKSIVSWVTKKNELLAFFLCRSNSNFFSQCWNS